MFDDADAIKVGVEGLFDEVVIFGNEELDDLEAWAMANLDDGELDIIWVPAYMPNLLYPVPNEEPDNSLAEQWLDNGNTFISVGEYFACGTFETGAEQLSGRDGSANILDLPGILAKTNSRL